MIHWTTDIWEEFEDGKPSDWPTWDRWAQISEAKFIGGFTEPQLYAAEVLGLRCEINGGPLVGIAVCRGPDPKPSDRVGFWVEVTTDPEEGA